MTTVVNKKHEPYDVYIGRGSKWGNPFARIGTRSSYPVRYVVDPIAAYEDYIRCGIGSSLLADLHELKGKRLGCFCKPAPCHGDVLVKLVEEHCK